MHCAKFSWNWLSGSINFVHVFSLFRNYLPLEKDRAPHLNKLDSPSPKNALCQVWLKLVQWFLEDFYQGCNQVWLKLAQWLWRIRYLNFFNIFSLFRNYLPWEKGGVLHLNKLEPPSPKDAYCQVWLKLTQWFWRRRWKCEKFTTTTTTTTDKGQILIREAHLSLQ